ncbi:hypothetical protein SBADM41S_09392 [Streptomyces badius]
MVGRPRDETDALVAERDEMTPGLLDGDGVVAGFRAPRDEISAPAARPLPSLR